MSGPFPQYGRHNDQFGSTDDDSYETAPTAPGGAEPDNAYSGDDNFGASVPRRGDVDLSLQMRQGIDDSYDDQMDSRGLNTRPDNGD